MFQKTFGTPFVACHWYAQHRACLLPFKKTQWALYTPIGGETLQLRRPELQGNNIEACILRMLQTRYGKIASGGLQALYSSIPEEPVVFLGHLHCLKLLPGIRRW